jgi:very-short-patch-repair endonuclease
MKRDAAERRLDDSRLSELAFRQHGVVALWQLITLGYTERMRRTLIAKGFLIPLHRAVFAVGHRRLTSKGRWMAAVLASGPDAVLSHAAAAALHNLRNAPQGLIDVTSPQRRKVEGVRTHWARTLDPADVTIVDAIAVTTVARTLLDEAETLSAQRLRSRLEATLRQNLFDLHAIEPTLDRNPGRHGAPKLKAALAALEDIAPWTQSEKEQHLLELVREHGLPEPRANVIVNGETVDFHWPQAKLIVEVDGFEWHKTRTAFENDRRRDAKLQALGYRVLRFTARRITEDPAGAAREIEAVLRLATERGAA